jgi:hypothetical protein
MFEKVYGFATVFILMITVGAIAIYDPSLLNLYPATTLSISQINVDPQGAPVGDEWTGSYWNILVYVNANDQLAGVVLPEGQTGSVTYQGAIKALETGAKVEVKIDPGQPYLIRDVVEKNMHVAPAATGGGTTVSAFDVRYYDWAESTFRIYTPFTVSIYKDGALVGSQTLNLQGSSQVQSVSTSEGAVRIENLGTLGGSYTSFSYAQPIAILKGGSNIYDYGTITTMVDGSQPGSVAGSSATKYSDYWYGISRNSNSQAYNPTVVIGSSITNVYNPNNYGGWSGSSSGGNSQPVKPVTFSSDRSTLPSDERSYSCLTEWLQSKSVTDLSTTTFQTKATGYSGALWQSSSFVTDTNGQTALKLEIPWGAFGTPLVSIRVPTELADTWIEQPIVTATSVSAVWQSTGTDHVDIYGANRIAVQVTNTGTVTGSSRLTIESGNSKLSVTPLEMTVNNLVPNVPQTVYFDSTNLGVESETANVPITIIAHDTYTGAETGRCTLYGTLKPTLVTGTTTLNLRVVEKGTDTPIVGLGLTVQYGNMAPTPFTNANGEVTMTLATSQGGAYTGQVFVESVESSTYYSASTTYTLNSATTYQYTLEVERKDTTYPGSIDWVMIALVVAIIAVVAGVGGGGYYVVKKRKHRRGRR